MGKNSVTGHVYILTSPNTNLVKIGGTDFPPAKRIKEINTSEPYRSLGPWTLYDFREVDDWRKVEHHLHYAFRDSRETSIAAQRELFAINPFEASLQLRQLDAKHMLGKPKIDRLFNDELLAGYIQKLFICSGLLNWLDIQGFWTLSLFPSTSGGRYFTLNIGSHEVAFSPYAKDNGQFHMVYMDKLLLDYAETASWLAKYAGEIYEETYTSADDHSIAVYFSGSFEVASQFLEQPGVRRAIIAYWTERLVVAAQKGTGSVFSRFHNYNAVAELRHRIQSPGIEEQ